MGWPEIVELRDVTITPLNSDNSKRRLSLAADPPSSALQHFRGGRTRSAVEICPLSPSSPPASRVVEDVTVYGGLLFRHFGHALAESIHRLWPRLAFAELRRAKIAFSLTNNTKVMPYFRQALALHGIPRLDVIRIEEPICFRRLFVGPQARQMAGPTLIDGYRSMLDGELAKRLPPPTGDRRLYLSRRRHQHTGSFYGESLVETVLAAEGFEVIYPEQHPLSELVAMLRSSTVAVFAEGSAIHALELCGSGAPAAFVIGRRRGSVGRFEPLLSNICDKWSISDRLLGNIGMSSNPKKHSGVLDMSGVLNDLWSFLELRPGRPFSRADVAAAVVADLEEHIHDWRNPRDDGFEMRAEELREFVLSSLGGHLQLPAQATEFRLPPTAKSRRNVDGAQRA